MQTLNFPDYKFKLKRVNDTVCIFDPIRKKFITLKPEEWVRQHVIQFLINDLQHPKSLISVEKQIKVASVVKRYDVACYRPDASISLLVECKAPNITINQDIFNYIARYNFAVNADYLMVSNGIKHFFCRVDYKSKKYVFLNSLPPYRCL